MLQASPAASASTDAASSATGNVRSCKSLSNSISLILLHSSANVATRPVRTLFLHILTFYVYVETVIFAVGLDGRRETAFEPNNLQQFNHGSAQASGIIAAFICDTFVNSCGADATAQANCAAAKAAISTLGKVGSTADVWNKFFGKTTNFAAVQAIVGSVPIH